MNARSNPLVYHNEIDNEQPVFNDWRQPEKEEEEERDMKTVYKNLMCLLGAWLMSWACSQPQHTQSQMEAMFRGDSQHTGVYDTKGVHQFKAIKWAHQTNGPVRSSPAVTNETIYFGSGDGNLYAVDTQNGHERWRHKTAGAVHSSPAVANGVVYFTSRDNCLYAVEAHSGNRC